MHIKHPDKDPTTPATTRPPTLVALDRKDFNKLMSRVESTEEDVDLLAAKLEDLHKTVTRLDGSINSTISDVKLIKSDLANNKAGIDKLNLKLDEALQRLDKQRADLTESKAETSRVAAAVPERATIDPPLISYKTDKPGPHKFRVVLGTSSATTTYELHGASFEGSAVFVVTESDDGLHHVLTLECDDFTPYQDFCTSTVTLAHMLHICFPDHDFTFHKLSKK